MACSFSLALLRINSHHKLLQKIVCTNSLCEKGSRFRQGGSMSSKADEKLEAVVVPHARDPGLPPWAPPSYTERAQPARSKPRANRVVQRDSRLLGLEEVLWNTIGGQALPSVTLTGQWAEFVNFSILKYPVRRLWKASKLRARRALEKLCTLVATGWTSGPAAWSQVQGLVLTVEEKSISKPLRSWGVM